MGGRRGSRAKGREIHYCFINIWLFCSLFWRYDATVGLLCTLTHIFISTIQHSRFKISAAAGSREDNRQTHHHQWHLQPNLLFCILEILFYITSWNLNVKMLSKINRIITQKKLSSDSHDIFLCVRIFTY